MTIPKSRLAKLAPPRSCGAVPRVRLFERLESLSHCACVWVCGPPGAGKTTLAATWLESKAHTSFWYQMDAGDEDPASFFAYLTPAIAERLSGCLDSRAVLDALYRRHCFIERRASDKIEYRYHDLFRAFLRESARQRLGDTAWTQVLSDAAAMLEDSDEVEQAAELLIEARNWVSLSALLGIHAEVMLSRGRWRTLLQWLNAMPTGAVASNPWLLYWQGLARGGEDPAGGRIILEKAYAAFSTDSVFLGQLRSCSAIIDSYFQEWNTVEVLDRWIEEMQALLSLEASHASSARVGALKSLATALLYRAPTSPSLPDLMQELLACWRLESQANDRLLIVALLFDYFSLMGDFATLQGIAEQSKRDACHEDALPARRWKL